VKLLRTIAIFGFMAFWLAASNHCRLENVPGLNFFVCCDHDDTGPHEDDDCATDNCASIEGNFYKSEDGPATLSVPSAILLTTFPAPPPAESATKNFHQAPGPAVPPDLPKSWQFSHRTAIPVRAPSTAS
jgi:hypothetical protein